MTKYSKTETYYIVKCYGVEQEWSLSNPKELEKPKPFEGYISSTDWAFQASSSRGAAYKFSKIPKIPKRREKRFDYAIGPWWYQINRIEILKVTRTIEEVEEIVPYTYR